VGDADGGRIRGVLAEVVVMRESRAAAFLLALVLSGAGCAVNPATGRKELSLVSEAQEVEMGRQGAEETLRSLPLVADSTVQQYVRSVAMGLVGVAERPGLSWRFHVLDDAAVNAFAYPGGFIFITRGILTHMNSEAELAGVLGHEIGHVTARHTATQITRAQIVQAGLAVGSVVSPTIGRFAGAAGQGLGLLFLKFGREAEYQADELGFRYMTRKDYDPRGLSSLFAMLDRQGQLGRSGGRVPEWQSTHPDPENRVARNDARVAGFPSRPDTLRVGLEEFLRHVDGMVFGENPRDGYFDGPVFNHPDLKFRVTFPAGWKLQNQPASVVGMSPGEDAVMALSLATAASPAEALRTFLGQEGIQPGVTSASPVNGLPAASGEFGVTTEQGTIQGAVQYVQHEGRLFQLLAYTTPAQAPRYGAAFRQALGSFARLTDPAALGKQPVRVRLVRIDREMTLSAFQRANPSAIPLARLAVINGVDSTSTLRAGRWVKQVR
jgi:predicted Zn-dependent protease